MNNNIQDPNNVNVEAQQNVAVQQAAPVAVEEPFDPRTVTASVIGELRKDRIGKPILVIEMLVLFGVVLVALPLFYSIANDENGPIYKYLHRDEEIIVEEDPESKDAEYLDGAELQMLSLGTGIKYEGIVIENFKLNNDSIECRMFDLNQQINFDKEEYYLEIYSNSQEKIASIKLSGTYDYTPKNTTLSSAGLSFNANMKYYGKIVKMNDALYPEVQYDKDMNEVGSFTCRNANDSHRITYSFKNDYLTDIEDIYKFVKADYTDDAYADYYKKYIEKSRELGAEYSTTEEDADGFTYIARLPLEQGYVVPDKVTDNNYYIVDSKAKVIHYAQQGKGFVCE